MFEPDGQLRFFDVDGSVAVAIQAADLATALASESGALVHHVFSYEITFQSATEARGVWTMEDYRFPSDAEEKARWGLGTYHETYRRAPDGWRFVQVDIVRSRLDFLEGR